MRPGDRLHFSAAALQHCSNGPLQSGDGGFCIVAVGQGDNMTGVVVAAGSRDSDIAPVAFGDGVGGEAGGAWEK